MNAGQQGQLNEGATLAGAIPRSSVERPAAPGQVRTWRQSLAEAIRSPEELWRVLDLPLEALPAAQIAAKLFPVVVPRGFAARMRRGDLQDPLLRQVVPVAEETEEVDGFGPDPLAEAHCSPAPGLLHKYEGRALLVTTGTCAVHCRYCFRRHFPYGEVPRAGRWWTPAVEHLRTAPGIEEVLLSGGDPLALPESVLEQLCADLETLPGLRRLRFHTRLPVVLPERIDGDFLALLVRRKMPIVMVIHANHPQELNVEVAEACRALRRSGVTLLNQSVLLAGVNDDAAVLAELSRRLFDIGVLPYYLHALDRVRGAQHFQVTDLRSAELMRDLAVRLPGYLVPRWVREEAGAPGKTILPWSSSEAPLTLSKDS